MDAILGGIKDLVGNALKGIYQLLMGFFGSLIPLVGFVLGVVFDPTGFFNWCACLLIDLVAYPFPVTPDSMKLGSIIAKIGDSVPAIGSALMLDIAQTIGGVFVIYVGVKIYKLIPFKMS